MFGWFYSKLRNVMKMVMQEYEGTYSSGPSDNISNQSNPSDHNRSKSHESATSVNHIIEKAERDRKRSVGSAERHRQHAQKNVKNIELIMKLSILSFFAMVTTWIGVTLFIFIDASISASWDVVANS